MERIKVMVSPFYGGEEWIDEGTGITFKHNRVGEMSTYSIPASADLSGIRKAIRLNTLFLVEGTLEDLKESVKESEPEVIKEVVAPVETEEVEVKVEVEEEEKPKTAPAKKRPAKK